jgi:hypothetical protein
VLFTANHVDIHNHIHTAFVPPTKLTALEEQSQLLTHSGQECLDNSTRELFQRARRAIWDLTLDGSSRCVGAKMDEDDSLRKRAFLPNSITGHMHMFDGLL